VRQHWLVPSEACEWWWCECVLHYLPAAYGYSAILVVVHALPRSSNDILVVVHALPRSSNDILVVVHALPRSSNDIVIMVSATQQLVALARRLTRW
jgi:hypothetical protein